MGCIDTIVSDRSGLAQNNQKWIRQKLEPPLFQEQF